MYLCFIVCFTFSFILLLMREVDYNGYSKISDQYRNQDLVSKVSDQDIGCDSEYCNEKLGNKICPSVVLQGKWQT